MGLKNTSAEFRDEILKFNLKSTPDVVTGLANLTNSVTVNAYLSSLGQYALINDYKVLNPGDVDTDGISARKSNLSRTLNTPNDITTGLDDLNSNQQYTANMLNSKGELTIINDFTNLNPGDVLTDAVSPRTTDIGKNLNTPSDITSGVNNLSPNTTLASQYLSGRGAFSVINDFNVVNPGDVLTDAVSPRNLDLAKNLNTPSDITSGVNNLSPNTTLASQYLSGRGSFSVINDFNVLNPGDVLTDAVSPRNLDLARNLNTPSDITAGVNDLSPTSAIASQYLSGRGSFSVINDFIVNNPGDVLTDAISPRTLNFAQTLNTPSDITSGVGTLSGSLAAQYLAGRGTIAPINTVPNTNPGDVLTDSVTPRAMNFARALNTPSDISSGVGTLSGAFAAQYLSGRGAFSVINDYINTNPGDVVTDSLTPRTANFNRTLNTPLDITAGVTSLSGSLAAQYLAGRGLDTIINDYLNANPGDVVTDSLTPRTLNLNKSLNTPLDITSGVLNLSGTFAAQYLSGRGTPTVVNDFNVINPGDVDTEAVIPRTMNLNMSLVTPTDITTGIGTLTANATLTAQYLAGRGTNTTINTFTNLNPGDVQTDAAPLRISLLGLNMVKDPNDATDSYTLSNPGTIPVGADTIVNNYIVQNQNELTPLQLQYINANAKNLYQPESTVVYDILADLILNQSPNTPQNPYLTEDKLNNADPTELVLGDFLNTPTASTPLSALLGEDLNIANLLTEPGLKNDTLLAQIGAIELRFHLEARLASKLAAEALGLVTFDEMLTNPLKIAEALKNPSSILERGNSDITTFKGGLGKLASFVSDVSGLGGLASAFFSDDSVLLLPTGQSDYDSDNKLDSRDEERLRSTGLGQRFMTFSNLTLNKYSPDYIPELSVGSGKLTYNRLRKSNDYDPSNDQTYMGTATEKIFKLLTDTNGNQVTSAARLTTEITTKNGTVGFYSEPGVEDVSKYGSKQTSFIWRGTTREKYWDPTLGGFFDGGSSGAGSQDFNWDESLENENLSKFKQFRGSSIMAKTQELLNNSDVNVVSRSIDQTKTKFYDGYNFSAKGSGVISPFKTPRLNKNEEVIGYDYLVPGLDAAGNRVDKKLYDEVELCRTWTKAKPFSKVTDLIRWKELNRKERNSVLDRYGNLNIHPSALNVNEGYGRLGDGLGDAVVEGFGEKRARKYMFSLENLAWRDSQPFTDLPPCEKGSNGGRIMWFPPYNMRFTDDTNTNWTSHQFLGRPEPIYTYNNTERSGTLSWDIVVDHPSILNLLVSKEFASITDGEVDELLAAFWAGCLEYDIFELARIWGVFTDSDIEYFKKVISDLDVRLPNDKIRKSVESSGSFQSTAIDIEGTEVETPIVLKYNLFFENDIPLRKYNDKTFEVKSYNEYFKVYRELAQINDTTDPSYQQNHRYERAKAGGSPVIAKEENWIRYDQTIGSKAIEGSRYFFEKDRETYRNICYGYEEQYDSIRKKSNLRAESFANVKGYDMYINVVAHASPSAPGQSLTKIKDYNDKLASRRFVSVIKWFITDVLSSEKVICSNSEGVKITRSNVDSLFTEIESTNYVMIYRADYQNPGSKQEIYFSLDTSNSGLGLTTEDVFTGQDFISNFGKPSTYNGVPYYKVAYGPKDTYYMVGTYNDYNKITEGGFKVDGVTIDKKFIGTLLNIKNDASGKQIRVPFTEADIICGNLSPQASFCRRVAINTELQKQSIEIERTPPSEEKPPLVTEAKNVQTNVTKREIAQRILGKLLTECDYFEFLSEEAPIVYDSLKQKLKYFTPAFHSMTPEGLNARLTFLQQCMRPGETIQKTQGDYSCDAKNTSFGRPPVCVLRIGDFYHTKIVLNNLNISYDPLVFDLNPEGIGVQPMIAKVSVNFKYIGGQGLRRHVDELQTALSFNYYANTDVYDERTFANTDQRERDLINLEEDFFAQNSLDLIPIVKKAELITPSTENLEIPVGTIGVISKRLLPKLAGGTYYNDLIRAQAYDPSVTSYNEESCVIWQGQYYVRNNIKIVDNTEPSNPDPTNTKYWTEIDYSNFGEFSFREEYGRNYMQRYEIKYDGLFSELYQTFGEYTNSLVLGSATELTVKEDGFSLVDFKQESPISSESKPYRVLVDMLNGKNYQSKISENEEDIINSIIYSSNTSEEDSTSESINSVSGDTLNDGVTYAEIFNNIAKSKRYIELGNLFKQKDNYFKGTYKFEALKLHLHPQEYMFKVGDGLGLPYNFTANSSVALGDNGSSTKFHPGNLTNGYTNNRSDAYSETGGIYFKETTISNKIYKDIMDNFAKEFKTKIALNTLAIWDKNLEPSLNTFNNFYTDLDDSHRISFRNYLINEFNNYYSMLTEHIEENNKYVKDKVAKMGVIIAGLSLPTYGYDVRKTKDGRNQLYEVIPNGKELNTGSEEIFGYDPYTEYKTLGYFGAEKLKFSEVDNLYRRASELNWGSGSTLRLEDYLSLGNGLYFFKQQVNSYSSPDNFDDYTWTEYEYERNMDYIAKEFGYDDRFSLPYQYNFENYLPKSIELSNNTDIKNSNKSYFFDTPFSFNPGQYGTNTTKETTANDLVMRNPQGDVISVSDNSFKSSDYKMKYVWEKLNYELFDFSNKTIDLMMSDELESRLKDLDLTYTPEYEFNEQLNDFTITGATSGTTSGTTEMGKLLFYYGDNKKPSERLTDLNYYMFNDVSSELGDTLDSLNKKIVYEFVVNDAFVSSLPEANKKEIYLNIVGEIGSGNTIKMSAMLETVFLEFIHELFKNKARHTEALHTIFSDPSVPTNIKSDSKKTKTYISRKKERIRKTLDDTFNLFGKFIDASKEDMTNLFNYNNESIEKTCKNINENLFENTSTTLITAGEINNKLTKGGIEDYTLLMRETSKLDPTIVKNLDIFTNHKDNPIINLTSTLEPKEEIEEKTTKLNQLVEEYPEVYKKP